MVCTMVGTMVSTMVGTMVSTMVGTMVSTMVFTMVIHLVRSIGGRLNLIHFSIAHKTPNTILMLVL